jgi:hypothetical protein
LMEPVFSQMKPMESKKYSFSLDQLRCTAADVLLVMGYKEPSGCPIGLTEINAYMAELAGELRIMGGTVIINDPVIDTVNYRLHANKTEFDLGKLITTRMRNIEKLAVFACTAGPSISTLSGKKKEAGDLLGSYVIDSAGTVIVEAAMDRIQELLAEQAARHGFRITNRYSPGYCHWPTSEQRKIFTLLPQGFCGIKLTESYLMLPVKSVSGVIGIGKDVKQLSHQCSICSMKDCYLRKEACAFTDENDFE